MLSHQPKRTSFGEILLAVKAEVIKRTGLPAARVIILARDQAPKAQAEQIIYLRPRRFTSIEPENTGGGRSNTRLTRQLDLILSSRMATDASTSDEDWLTHPTRGYYALEDAAVDALQEFFPTDGQGNALVFEPIRIMSEDQTLKLGHWGQANATFEVGYMPPLDQTRQ